MALGKNTLRTRKGTPLQPLNGQQRFGMTIGPEGH